MSAVSVPSEIRVSIFGRRIARLKEHSAVKIQHQHEDKDAAAVRTSPECKHPKTVPQARAGAQVRFKQEEPLGRGWQCPIRRGGEGDTWGKGRLLLL
jgi:hypothetical protein